MVVVKAVLVTLLAVAAIGVRAQGVCDPLVPQYCLAPFPNNFWTVKDPVTPTGLRVVFPQESVPPDNAGVRFSLAEWSRLDGFSPSASPMAHFPNVSLTQSNVPTWVNMARSLESDCPTIFLEADTGVLIPHFAELDHTTEGQTDRQMFMMWPSKQLRFGTRYIVAMRNLRNEAGQLIPPTQAFQALRDGVPTGDPDIENRRDLYEDIFRRLALVGVGRSSVQLAWEFTTASLDYTTKYIIKARDDAFTRIPATGPIYRITSVEDNVSTNTFRRIKGEMTVPHYHTRNCMPGCRLVLDENEDPVYQGMTEATFTVNIPHICANGTIAPCPILQYGHGLLGGQGEADGGTATGFQNRYGYIGIAVDMWGMCAFDVPSIGQALLNDLADMIVIPDRSVQGIVNHHLAVKMMMGSFASDPSVIINGRSIVDTSRRYYWGISQGGIYGAVVLATSVDIERGQLGVPGGPYPLLLARSVDFDPYFEIIKRRYENPFDRILILTLFGLVWDWTEPGGYMATLAGEYRLPGSPFDHRAFIDYASGDAQVSHLGAKMMARSMNAKIFPNNIVCNDDNEASPIFGLQVTAGPVTSGSVMVGWDFGIGCGPVVNLPPLKDTDTHSRPRNQARNQLMAHQLFSTGVVYDECGGQGCYAPYTSSAEEVEE